ncbi:OmpA family protein [Nonomuraea sp. NPDC049725]|uniref:OmpA family protein n=1 Tax=Nonomuraea sp. NPDC049725 TaxID=3154508 RepID=UPI003447FABC
MPASITRIAAALLAGLTLTACSGSSGSPGSEGSSGNAAASLGCELPGGGPLALAVGAHANAPEPAIRSEVVDLMRRTAKAGHDISVIRLDGTPEVVFDTEFASDAGNDVALEDDVNAYLTEVERTLGAGARAKAPEVDVLTALSLAADATGPGGSVVLVDPGLQTVAPLDFREVIDAEPAQVVAYLRDKKLLPDLTGRTVLLSGLGYTATPQPEPHPGLRRNIVAIWREIARAGGAACVAVDARPNHHKAATDTPAVTVVVPPAVPTTFTACGEAELSEGNHVGFEQGTATFREPAEARKTLANLAATIGKDRLKVRLTGSTSAEGGKADNLRLSRERAEAVKRELVALGVPDADIATEGRGEQLRGRADDLAPDGTLLPGPAARNRKVVVRLACPAT